MNFSFKKTLLRTLALCLITLTFIFPFVQIEASTPSILSYQGRLTNDDGDLLGGASGTAYFFKFSFWDNDTINTGSRVWPTSAPSASSIIVKEGVFNVKIGDTDGGYPDTLDYNFNTDENVYLQVEVSANNVTFETLGPRQQITSPAYSDIAGVANSVSGVEQSSFGTTTSTANSIVTVQATSSVSTAMTLLASLGQTANIFNILDADNNSLFSINNTGGLTINSATSTNLFASFLNSTNSVFTNATSTNIFSTNLSATNFTLSNLSGILLGTNGVISSISTSTLFSNYYTQDESDGLYDLLGAATSSVINHENIFDHDLIATALQSFTETDPIFMAASTTLAYQPIGSYLTSFTEVDPVYTAWDKSTGISITESQISDLQSYLTYYTETDPIFMAASTTLAYQPVGSYLTVESDPDFDSWLSSNPTSGTNTGDITLANNTNGLTISNQVLTLGLAGASATGTLSVVDWNIFNNKQPAGSYLTSYTETDPIFMAASTTLTYQPIGSYLTVESDPTYTGSSWFSTTNNSTDWDTSFGWGDHSAEGYLTTLVGQNISNLTNDSGYLTSLSGALLATGATTGATSQAQAFTNGIITGKIYPSADSTSAFGIFKADGTTNVLNVDTTNGRVGIGTTTPGAKLDVNGTFLSREVTEINNGATIYLDSSVAFTVNDISKTYLFNMYDSGSIRMSLTRAGRLSVGALNGGSLLNVRGSSSIGDTYYNIAAPTSGLIVEGNVGIGTTTPSAKLHTLGTTEQLRVGYDASNYFTTTVGSTGIVTYDAVGAGSLFQFSDDVNLLGGKILRAYRSTNDRFTSMYTDGVGGYVTGPASDPLYLTANTNLYFRSGGATTQMTLTTAGLFGIGATPTSKLTIGSGQISTPLGLVSAPSYSFTGDLDTGIYSPSAGSIYLATNGANYFQFSSSGNFLFPNGGTLRGSSGTASAPGYAFFSDATMGIYRAAASAQMGFSVDAAERLTLKTGGNVGIGTTTPSAKLAITGTAGTADIFAVASSTNARLFTVTSAGNVGIGTSTPTVALAVVGNGQFTAVTSGAYATDLNLTSDGTLTTSASDIRLKTNLEAISDSMDTSTLDKVLQLKPYTFNWKSEPDGKKDIGLIAQDVENIFPEITFTNKVDGYKGVNYSRLAVILVSAIQELNNQVIKMSAYVADGVATFTEVISNKITAKEQICIGETCVDEQILKELLEKNSVASTTSVEPEQENNPDPVAPIDPVVDTNNPEEGPGTPTEDTPPTEETPVEELAPEPDPVTDSVEESPTPESEPENSEPEESSPNPEPSTVSTSE